MADNISASFSPGPAHSPAARHPSSRSILTLNADDSASAPMPTHRSSTLPRTNHAQVSQRAAVQSGSGANAFNIVPLDQSSISQGEERLAAIHTTTTPAHNPTAPSSRTAISPFNPAMTETLEKQPRLASGYEWNERHHSLSQGQDGTACLSVEPDGDGYLGESSKSASLKAHV